MRQVIISVVLLNLYVAAFAAPATTGGLVKRKNSNNRLTLLTCESHGKLVFQTSASLTSSSFGSVVTVPAGLEPDGWFRAKLRLS
jgi:hypothetical protein